jgi:hypothetical protein
MGQIGGLVGRVVDANGNGISGVEIGCREFTGGSISTKSFPNGYFILILPSGSMGIYVEKKGYVSRYFPNVEVIKCWERPWPSPDNVNITPIVLESGLNLLLHMDGADDSTNFVDSSASGHTVTANGLARIKTADKKFGTACMIIFNNTGYLSIPTHSDFAFGTDPFTISWWWKSGQTGSLNNTVMRLYQDSNNYLKISMNQITAITVEVVFDYKVNGTTVCKMTWENSATQWFSLDLCNNWNHFALIRGFSNYENTIAFCSNGKFVPCENIVGSQYDINFSNFNKPLEIGRDSTNYLHGRTDEFCIAPVALWTDSFDVPEKAFV